MRSDTVTPLLDDQRQGGEACRRTDFERVAEVVGDFEDLYSDILADAGLIREDA